MIWLINKIVFYFRTRRRLKQLRVYIEKEIERVKDMPMVEPPTQEQAIAMYNQEKNVGMVLGVGTSRYVKEFFFIHNTGLGDEYSKYG